MFLPAQLCPVKQLLALNARSLFKPWVLLVKTGFVVLKKNELYMHVCMPVCECFLAQQDMFIPSLSVFSDDSRPSDLEAVCDGRMPLSQRDMR